MPDAWYHSTLVLVPGTVPAVRLIFTLLSHHHHHKEYDRYATYAHGLYLVGPYLLPRPVLVPYQHQVGAPVPGGSLPRKILQLPILS